LVKIPDFPINSSNSSLAATVLSYELLPLVKILDFPINSSNSSLAATVLSATHFRHWSKSLIFQSTAATARWKQPFSVLRTSDIGQNP
jgi:hypothetical protein